MKKVNIFTTETETSYFSRLKPGKRVFVGTNKEELFSLQVNAVTDENTIYLERSADLEIRQGQNVEIWLVSFDAMYNFKGEYIRSDNVNSVILLTGEVERIQRRNYIREFIYGTVDYKVLQIDKVEMLYQYRAMIMGNDLNSVKIDRKGKIVNISGGGFLLHTQDELESRDYVFGTISMIEKQVPFMGQVVRVNRNTGHYGIEIIFISDEEREFIIHKIFELHRKYIGVLKKEKKDEEVL